MALPDNSKFEKSENGKTDFIVLKSSVSGQKVYTELFTHKNGDNPQAFIKGSGLGTWKVGHGKDKEGNGYSQTENTAAVAIFNSDRSNRLTAMSVGEVSGDKKTLTVSAVLNNDGVLIRLPEPITVNLKRRDGITTIVDEQGTEQLSKITTLVASKHFADVALQNVEQKTPQDVTKNVLGTLVPTPDHNQQGTRINKELQNIGNKK